MYTVVKAYDEAIHAVLDGRLLSIQNAMEQELKSMSIAQVSKETRARIERDAAERERKRAAWE